MNYRKRIFVFLLSGALVSCGIPRQSDSTPLTSGGSSSSAVVDNQKDLFFKTPGFADCVYVLSYSSLSADEFAIAGALQGILAQKASELYIQGADGDDGSWFQACKSRYGFASKSLASVWDAVDQFSSRIKGQKYVVYDSQASGASYSDDSINQAAVIAACENYLPVPSSLVGKAQEHGLSQGEDARSYTTRTVFEKYKDQLNNAFLIHQSPSNYFLRDYGIAGKAMCFYSSTDDYEVSNEIKRWAKANAPILGWTDNEVDFVSSNSLLSKITYAADYSANLSFYSAASYKTLAQRKNDNPITPEKGKHYAAILMSDGDNVQWMENDFSTSNKYYGSPKRGAFPVTWTTSPALYDLAPDILKDLYSKETANDGFIAGPSGVGYVNPYDYASSSIDEYAAKTASYMKASDLHYVNLLDGVVPDPENRSEVVAPFAKQEGIEGGVWSLGDYYLGGNGSVTWSNDKPFVSVRESLWLDTNATDHNKYYGYPERIAQRVNAYSKDYTKIEGYSVILAHVWSAGTMQGVSRLASCLDDDVVLVSVPQLLRLIKDNVPHSNVDTLNDIKPSDFDGKLTPLLSEQYDAATLSAVTASDARVFAFSGATSSLGWQLGNGGEQYDSSRFVDASGGGAPAICLDGSDLGNLADPYPNAWAYNRFVLSSDASSDNWLNLHLGGSSGNVDGNFRVRVLELNNGKIVSTTLVSPDYTTEVNEFGYYLHTSSSPGRYAFDLAPFKGKDVIVSLEQDDSGEGSGEAIYLYRISIDAAREVAGSRTWWDNEYLFLDWSKAGTVTRLPEGVSLEASNGPSSISDEIAITNELKYLKFYVRMFIRSGTQADTSPELSFSVNGTQVKPFGVEGTTLTIASDYYRCCAYDLSAYVGTKAKVTLTSLKGEHAAIYLARQDGACTNAEVNSLYSEAQLKEMVSKLAV
ncbi:MAG: hypothetical protein LKK13_02365 [Bacilli bacterium]|jgi:hypothetical protein|nr:hypothetical protein [Bacilli bacterium]